MQGRKDNLTCGVLNRLKEDEKVRKRLMYKKHVGITVCLLLVGALLSVGFTGISKAEPGYSGTIIYAGCRESSYGISPLPVKEEWERDMMTMASYWPGSTGAGIWIVGIMDTVTWEKVVLEFPAPDNQTYDYVIFEDVDRHENYLAYFDTHGIKVWLQVEPAFADMGDLVDLVLDRYGNHECVIGFGVDVEWNKYTKQDSWGVPVTDAVAENWESLVKAKNENYTLFLKHFTPDWLPPNYRGDIVFVDDSQQLHSLSKMVDEFGIWASTFYPNTVMFQYGYEADRNWWSKLNNPPKDIGEALDDAIPNDMGVFWVDFTLREVFPPLEDDTTAPVIENVASSDITYDSATITWDTDEVSDSVVNYGKTTALGSSKSDATMVTAHSITLTELSASTKYYYEVQSTDSSSNTAVDDNNGSYYTFTTATPDTTPPVIENVASSNITKNSATITWDTDEIADSLVKYGTSPGSYTDNKYDSAYVTSHSIGLTDLVENTTYYYVVKSTDPSNNSSESSEYSFKTLAAGATVMHVYSINMFLETHGKNTKAMAEVTIYDAEDNPVPYAMLYGHWENATSDSDSAESDVNGVVSRWDLASDQLKSPPSGTTFTFVVDNIVKEGWTYDPEANVETSDSISVP